MRTGPQTGRLGRITLAAAGLSVAAYVVATVLLVWPVENPPVQDCGAPGAYLLTGRVETFIDEDGRFRDASGEVVQLTGAQAEQARQHSCRDRVAARAVPAGVLWLVATIVGLTALMVEVLAVRADRRRRRSAAPPAPWGIPQGDTGATPDASSTTSGAPWPHDRDGSDP